MNYLDALVLASNETRATGGVQYVCSSVDVPDAYLAAKPHDAASLIDNGLLQVEAILLGGGQVWARSAGTAAGTV
jgi:hypothetical protein